MTVTGIETVLACRDLDAMAEFLVEVLGARVELITPADDPREIVLGAAGTTIRLRRAVDDGGGRLIVRRESATGAEVVAPNGTILEFRPCDDALVVPDSEPEFSIVRAGDDFQRGRAEMGYRDLLPSRWGGRFIASHIRIPAGGDVADSVHFHRIRFQMIFCARGWADLVYEDQGPPFRLEAGDCVLQPPEIRHRVLRSSPGLEVIEIGCPAVHDTLVEHSIELPTAGEVPDRVFGGQRFVRHVANAAHRRDHVVDGLRFRDTGIADATDGLAGAVVIEAATVESPLASHRLTHDGEFVFVVVVHGTVSLTVDDGAGDRALALHAFDAVSLPPGARWTWSHPSADFEMLEVSLPAGATRCLSRP